MKNIFSHESRASEEITLAWKGIQYMNLSRNFFSLLMNLSLLLILVLIILCLIIINCPGELISNPVLTELMICENKDKNGDKRKMVIKG